MSSLPQLFVGQRNESILVFVDPQPRAITKRMKLVRKLRSMGATIATDPADAPFVLIDAQSDSGRELLRGWGDRLDAPMLQYTWVQKCIDAGRLLLGADQWGGCVAVDDGRRIGAEDGSTDDEDGPSQSPLPTPRNTPDDPRPRPRTQQQTLPNAISPPLLVSSPLQQTFAGSVTPTPSPRDQAFNQGLQHYHPPGPPGYYHPLMPHFGNAPMYNQPHISSHGHNMAYGQAPSFSVIEDVLQFGHQAGSMAGYSPYHPGPSQQPQSQAPPEAARRTSWAGFAAEMSGSGGPQDQEDVKPTQSPVSARPSSTGIFAQPSGKPLLFWIDIELPNKARPKLVKDITKNGGKIHLMRESADYVILGTNSKILSTVIAEGITPYKPDLITRSLERNALQDPDEFALGTKVKRRSGPSSDSDSFNSRKAPKTGSQIAKAPGSSSMERAQKPQSNRSQRTERPTSKTESAITTPIIPKRELDLEELDDGTSSRKRRKVSAPARTTRSTPSPSPPPQAASSHAYTQEDQDFIKAYAKYAFDENPEINNSQLAERIFKKLRRHTCNSLKTYVSQGGRGYDMVAAIRKKAGINKRKKERAIADEDAVTVAMQVQYSPRQPSQEMLIEHDMEVMSKFLVNEDNDQGDDAMYQALAAKFTCRSANSWEDFFAQHSDEVTRRFDAMAAENE